MPLKKNIYSAVSFTYLSHRCSFLFYFIFLNKDKRESEYYIKIIIIKKNRWTNNPTIANGGKEQLKND